MNVPTRLTAVLAIGAMLHASAGLAGDSDAPMFTFNGFGTFGVVHSSEDQADFTNSGQQPDGAGHTRDWSLEVDSLIAAQLNAAFTPSVSAVVQVLAEQNYKGTFRPHLEWASIKYQFTPELSVQLGRSTLPLFQLSDTRKVGLTFPWVRPPTELYHVTSTSTIDGITVNYRLRFGEWTHSLQLLVGQNDTKLPDNGGTAKIRDLWVVSNTAEIGSLSARIVATSSEVTAASVNQLFDAFRQFGPQGMSIADRYDLNRGHVSFFGVGANYDPGQWFVTAEWGGVFSHSVLGNRSGWYVSGGYRFGRFTPHVTYSAGNADNLTDPGLDVTALPPYLVGPATDLNAALNSILGNKPVERTVSIGARWDVRPNIALKMQFDHTDIGVGSTGVLLNIQPAFEPGRSFNLFSATVDFVF